MPTGRQQPRSTMTMPAICVAAVVTLVIASVVAISIANRDAVPSGAFPRGQDDRDRAGSSPPATERPSGGESASDVVRARAGSLGLFVVADRDFDPWTNDPSGTEQAFMRDRYGAMMVFSPYFDRRLAWFGQAYAYLDASAIYVAPTRDDRFELHPEWVLRDSGGEPLHIDFGCDEPNGCPQYVADVGHPGFRADLIDRIGALRDIGYAGVMLDDVNLEWRISDRQGTEERAIDPRTGDEMSLDDWRTSFAELVESVRRAFPDLTIVHNSLWFADSPAFESDAVERQIRSADYILMERGANDAGLTAGDARFGFVSFMDFVDRVHDLGGNVILFDRSDGSEAQQVYNWRPASW